MRNCRPTGSVYELESVRTISGQTNSFQRHMKVKITSTAMSGRESGRTMR